ncbi:MAG: Fe-S cluster assembly protein IscX [Pseudomonadota bacterium]
MTWTDTTDIAIALDEAYPEADPVHINFVDLMQKVLVLPEFTGTAERCGEKILEAIQMAWIDERE